MTPQEICDTALQEFLAAPRLGTRAGQRRRQLCVDFEFLYEDLQTMTLDQCTERFIKPAMRALAREIPEDVIFLSELEIPQHIQFSTKSGFLRLTGGTFLREVYAEDADWDALEEPEPIGLIENTIMRFDVLFELA